MNDRSVDQQSTAVPSNPKNGYPELCWLIEHKPGVVNLYFTGDGYQNAWTADPNKALRFPSRQTAEIARNVYWQVQRFGSNHGFNMPDGDDPSPVRICEHLWMNDEPRGTHETSREPGLGDEVILERYRERGEHEGWVIRAMRIMNDRELWFDLVHPMGGLTAASRSEVTLARSPVKASTERPQSIYEPCEHGVQLAFANCPKCQNQALREAFGQNGTP